MEEGSSAANRKGGRPRKTIKRDKLLGVKCTILEQKLIEHRAKAIGISVSEYLRTLALNPQQLSPTRKVLPKEVLLFTGTLHHLAANINQLAFQGNRGDRFTASKADELLALITEVRSLVQCIKTYLE